MPMGPSTDIVGKALTPTTPCTLVHVAPGAPDDVALEREMPRGMTDRLASSRDGNSIVRPTIEVPSIERMRRLVHMPRSLGGVAYPRRAFIRSAMNPIALTGATRDMRSSMRASDPISTRNVPSRTASTI